MKTKFKNAAKAVAARLTVKNAKWFLAVNVAGWVMQGAIYGTLTVCGMESLPAIISAKIANWLVFIGQCVAKAKS